MNDKTTKRPTFKQYAAEDYAHRYSDELGYEAFLIAARHRVCMRFLKDKRPASVAEVGCGPSLIIAQMGEEFDFIDSWSIFEASEKYLQQVIQCYTPKTPFGAICRTYKGYFEEIVNVESFDGNKLFDAVVLSGLLHETSEPTLLIEAAKKVLKPGGYCYVLVPNRMSFHRLLAVKMGLIDNPSIASDRNKLLGQDIVYTPESLKQFLESVGDLQDFEFDAHTTKIFTNKQNELLAEMFGKELMYGLEELGRDFPANAAEFAWIARYNPKEV